MLLRSVVRATICPRDYRWDSASRNSATDFGRVSRSGHIFDSAPLLGVGLLAAGFMELADALPVRQAVPLPARLPSRPSVHALASIPLFVAPAPHGRS